MHSPAITAFAIFAIASTVLTNPLNAPGVADAATTDAIALAEKGSEIATRETNGLKSPYICYCDTDGVCSYLEKQNEDEVVKRAEEVAKREEAVVKREEDVQKREAALVEREEDAVKRNDTIMARQNLGCPICCCDNCNNFC